MSISIKKLLKDNGLATILLGLVALYVLYMFYNYLSSKGSYSEELMTPNTNNAYGGQTNQQNVSVPGPVGNVKAAEESGNEVFSSVNNVQSVGQGLPTSCTNPSMTNPSDLLPKDTNSSWAELNPSGKGELANINLLKAGYHIGIDTIGSSLRNSNLQIRSEPPNPQINVGPWNNSTITHDILRPPLEIGQGPQ